MRNNRGFGLRNFGAGLAVATCVAAGVAATATPVGAAPGSGESGATTASSSDGQAVGLDARAATLMRLQEPLVEAANELQQVIDRNSAGYGGMRVEPEAGEVRLYWHGPVPVAVQGRARELNRPGRVVRLERAAYPFATLRAEAVRIARDHPSVASVGVEPDGSGLTVIVDEARAERVELNSSVPVAVAAGARPLVTTRWVDSAPFWGGAMMQSNARRNRCSSGFAAKRDGREGLITAHHCGDGDWSTPPRTISPPIGIGRSVATVNNYDLRFIETGSAGRIYDGGADRSGVGSGEFSKAVAGVSVSQAGVHVCTSGGYSGARCNIRIVQTFVVIQPRDPDGNIVGTYYSVRADHVGGENAAGEGDSGGPVFTLTGDKVKAEGIISAIETHFVPCTGIVSDDYGARRCSDRMYYSYVNASGWSVTTG